ncbi:MAG: type II toxin-antitoxin system death-on-curing family toxin [Patescibacteria group bacterium]
MARSTLVEISVRQIETVAHALAQELMEWGEPIPAFNTRFPDRLESCLKTPFQKFSGKSLYRGHVGKGAILFYLMIKNHPFQNGNKRVAVMTLLYFLYRNGWWIAVDNDDLYLFANEVAKSPPENNRKEIRRIRSFIRKFLVRRAASDR